MATNSNSDNGPGERHSATRVFASEFNDATHNFQKGNNKQSPRYTVLPTGELANRFYFVGTLTDVDVTDMESGQGQGVKATVNDGTESLSVSGTTQYNPDPANWLKQTQQKALGEGGIPQTVGVVGKADHWGDDGQQIDLRPESVVPVTEADRKAWTVETAGHTRTRVSDYQDQVTAAGGEESLAGGVKMAETQYEYEPFDYVANARDVLDNVIR